MVHIDANQLRPASAGFVFVFVVEPLQRILEVRRFEEAANGCDVLYGTSGMDLNRGEENSFAHMMQSIQYLEFTVQMATPVVHVLFPFHFIFLMGLPSFVFRLPTSNPPPSLLAPFRPYYFRTHHHGALWWVLGATLPASTISRSEKVIEDSNWLLFDPRAPGVQISPSRKQKTEPDESH